MLGKLPAWIFIYFVLIPSFITVCDNTIMAKIVVVYDFQCEKIYPEKFTTDLEASLTYFKKAGLEISISTYKMYANYDTESISCPRQCDYKKSVPAFYRNLRGDFNKYLAVLVLSDCEQINKLSTLSVFSSYCTRRNIAIINVNGPHLIYYIVHEVINIIENIFI